MIEFGTVFSSFSSAEGLMQMASPRSWSTGKQDLVLHKVSIRAHESSKPNICCAILLDSTMVPLLPTNLVVPPPPSSPTFIIDNAGHKGAGMFAARDISAGELIQVEHPAIVVPAIVPLPRSSGIYEALFELLDVDARRELLSMANCFSNDECCLEEGISLTNGTAIDLPVPSAMKEHPELTEYGAVYLKINRSNHRYHHIPFTYA